ncbi:MAG TPA: IclR family transcriptional regulator [Arenibaculum sp.]|nr:IclR family transcriptional regulator [Arenibaculum sp.]
MPDRSVVQADFGGAQSVDRALRLLTLIGRHADPGIALSKVVEESRLNKPTARRLLMALMRAGLVDQDKDSRRYFLGEEAYVLGTLAARRYGIHQLAMGSLVKLAERSEDSAFLSVRRDTYAVCLHREEGSLPIRTHILKAGDRYPLGVGAGSLALLAALPDEEVDAVIEANREIVAERYPPFTPDVMKDCVARTRACGYALNPGLVLPSSWGIGVTVKAPDGNPAGALSIAAIASRLTEERQRELAELLGIEARRLETRLASLAKPDDGQRRALRRAADQARTGPKTSARK